MRLPFFNSKGNSKLIVPLPEQVRSVFQVYFRSEGTPPSPEALKKMTGSWVAAHVPEPLRALLEDYLETPLFTITVEDKSRVPTPSAEIIEGFPAGEAEHRRYEEATHVATIVTDDILRQPRPGL